MHSALSRLCHAPIHQLRKHHMFPIAGASSASALPMTRVSLMRKKGDC